MVNKSKEVRKNCWQSHEWSGLHSSSDLDIANDVALLAELLELLVPALETMASEAASLRLEMNWQKTKVQALGSREDKPATITVLRQEVVEKFAYLGSLFTHNSKDLLIYQAAMISLVQLCKT